MDGPEEMKVLAFVLCCFNREEPHYPCRAQIICVVGNEVVEESEARVCLPDSCLV